MYFDKDQYGKVNMFLLRPSERMENIPDDTKEVCFTLWVKGRLCYSSEMYKPVHVTTATGRKIMGELKEVNPVYKISFGAYIDELMVTRENILKEMWGVDDEL